MAFTGVHITYGSVCKVSDGNAIFGEALWSQTMNAAGVTDLASSDYNSSKKKAFLVQAAMDIFVSVGKVPNAAGSPRYLVRGGLDVPITCEPGDKLAWVAA